MKKFLEYLEEYVVQFSAQPEHFSAFGVKGIYSIPGLKLRVLHLEKEDSLHGLTVVGRHEPSRASMI